ncbi:MAG: T9SS type A sorting domain-containing protein, partial [Bacteroidetes bacterium]|nr:T9SS type A sorting domain-containing protein [Bacteroidota bacterium]
GNAPVSACYGFHLYDSFGDGLGGVGNWQLRTTDGKVLLGDDFATGYSSPDFAPASPGYGSNHSFCLPPGPANIAATECGIFNNLPGNKVYCNKVTGATQYQFEFSDPDAGFIRRIVRTTNYVHFWDMVASPLLPGVKYFARVRTNVAGPVASAHWGSGCEMAIAPPVPCSQLIMAPSYGHSCNETRAFNPSTNNSFIYATPVVAATEYQFRIFNTSEGYDQTFIRSTYILQLKWNSSVAPPLVNGSTYNVEINVKANGVYSGFCPSTCTITIDNTGTLLGADMAQASFGEATLWPNPVRDGLVNLSITGLSAGSPADDPATTAGDPALTPQRISVDVQDIYGKQVLVREFGNSGDRFSTVLQLPGDLASGVYLVNITVNGKRTVQRLSIIK